MWNVRKLSHVHNLCHDSFLESFSTSYAVNALLSMFLILMFTFKSCLKEDRKLIEFLSNFFPPKVEISEERSRGFDFFQKCVCFFTGNERETSTVFSAVDKDERHMASFSAGGRGEASEAAAHPRVKGGETRGWVYGCLNTAAQQLSQCGSTFLPPCCCCCCCSVPFPIST